MLSLATRAIGGIDFAARIRALSRRSLRELKNVAQFTSSRAFLDMPPWVS